MTRVYCSNLDETFKTERKILPKWSPPYRVTTRELNSYTLETLIGTPIKGRFSARRLRRFWPREGTELASAQKEVEERCRKEEEEWEKTDLMKIKAERRLGREEERQITATTEEQGVEAALQATRGGEDDDEDVPEEDGDEEDGGVVEEELSDEEHQ